ncbi:MAG: pirin family protein [Acidobacteriaceae bacterium]
MLTIRPAKERGHANHGWLNSNFTFSFADYYDPSHMGFRALRVINEDYVAPGTGFGKHPHRDMEILTYVLEGAVEHEDSHGGRGVLVLGELQHMSAGSGILHSEMNPYKDETLHLLQIWLLPNERGIAPNYEQKAFRVQEEPNQLHLLASKDGRGESFKIYSDAELLAAKLDAGKSVEHRFRGKHGWLQVARGGVTANGVDLQQGDGVAISDEATLKLESKDGGEVLLFDLE